MGAKLHFGIIKLIQKIGKIKFKFSTNEKIIADR